MSIRESLLLLAVIIAAQVANAKTTRAMNDKKTIAPAAQSQAVAPENLETQATKELALQPEDLSTGVLPTPATVRSRIEEVRSPIHPMAYRLGVAVQPYTPAGTMSVSDLAPYDISSAGTKPMVSLEGQWLPVTFRNVAGLIGGGYLSLGYSQTTLNLRTPTGATLEDTKLNSLKAEGGLTASYQLPRSPLWSVHGNLGGGRMTVIQSSSSSYANASTSVWFASLGASIERALTPNFSVYLAYDFRAPIARSNDGADLPRHNVLLGFLGNFE